MYDILTSYNSSTHFSNTYGQDLSQVRYKRYKFIQNYIKNLNQNQEKLVFNHFSHNDNKLLEEYLNCKKRIQEIERNLIKSNDENISGLEFKVIFFL